MERRLTSLQREYQYKISYLLRQFNDDSAGMYYIAYCVQLAKPKFFIYSKFCDHWHLWNLIWLLFLALYWEPGLLPFYLWEEVRQRWLSINLEECPIKCDLWELSLKKKNLVLFFFNIDNDYLIMHFWFFQIMTFKINPSLASILF